MKENYSLNEDSYQANYSALSRMLDDMPMTYHQRKEVQHYLDKMEEIFREANVTK